MYFAVGYANHVRDSVASLIKITLSNLCNSIRAPADMPHRRECNAFSRHSFALSIQCVLRAYKDNLYAQEQVATASRLHLSGN
jgi:hypothetical protein